MHKLLPTRGTLSISIVEGKTNASPLIAGGGPAQSSKERVLAELQAKAKLEIGGGGGVGVAKKALDEVDVG